MFTWDRNIGIFRERGKAKEELDHGEGIDIVNQATDNIELFNAADALNGRFAEELADDLQHVLGRCCSTCCSGMRRVVILLLGMTFWK
jgi:hypothetical protein